MVELILPYDLINKIEKFWREINQEQKFKLNRKEFFIDSLPPYILDFTHFSGKATEIVYTIGFTYSKKGFDVFKVGESLYVSTNYQPFYNTIRRQKEEIEASIKAQLAQIASAITDSQLIAHDYRKYKHFIKIFKKIEDLEELIRNEKDEKKREELKKDKRREEIALRNIFIDQVDIHTGDFSIVNMARTRWTTFISDFLSLENEKTPEEILEKFPNITKAEAIQLAKKNYLYLEWKEEFKKIVRERESELRKLLIMRKNSIEKYKEMLRPLIGRYLSFKEEPIFFTSASMHFIKAATYPLLIDSTKWWIIKSIPMFFYEYEKVKPTRIDLERLGIITPDLANILDSESKEKAKNVVLPVEPSIDRVVLGGIEIINKNFGTAFSLKDLLEIREKISKKEGPESPSRERWKLSPYYVFIEISLDRTLFRTYSGIEIEDFWFEIKPFLISQNLAILIYLQILALEKYYEYEINSFFGENLMKEIEFEVDIGNKKVKQKANIWLDIRSVDYILEEEEDLKRVEEKRKSEIYKILKDYSSKFEKIFIRRQFLAPYLFYDETIADRYFSDYLVDSRNDINKTIASLFGFPI